MKVLTLNCQRGYQPGLKAFLQKTLESDEYAFLLLQEFAKEAPAYVRGVGPYEALEIYDDQVGVMTQTCIAYRKSFRLLDKSFLPFALMRKDPVVGFKHSTFGSLLARFEVGAKTVLIGSVHLHSGIDRTVRAAQIQRIKEQIAAIVQLGDIVLFGGDCNFGFPGECANTESNSKISCRVLLDRVSDHSPVELVLSSR